MVKAAKDRLAGYPSLRKAWAGRATAAHGLQSFA